MWPLGATGRRDESGGRQVVTHAEQHAAITAKVRDWGRHARQHNLGYVAIIATQDIPYLLARVREAEDLLRGWQRV